MSKEKDTGTPTEKEELIFNLAEFNPNAILLEPQHIYNSAIIGYDTEGRITYSIDGIMDALKKEGMNWDEAYEYFEFNTLGTFQSMNEPNKPIFIYEQ